MSVSPADKVITFYDAERVNSEPSLFAVDLTLVSCFLLLLETVTSLLASGRSSQPNSASTQAAKSIALIMIILPLR